ncbi:hypothetical protein PM082_007185 [Marasmius tenuissimus]|nr:hypothetical protein PM082_007185 [Marasmius tenuissimus]
MTTLFSSILTISLLIILLILSPVRGLTIKSRELPGVAKGAGHEVASGSADVAGQLSGSPLVGIVVGVVVLCLILAVTYYIREKKKAEAARRETEAQMWKEAGPFLAQ